MTIALLTTIAVAATPSAAVPITDPCQAQRAELLVSGATWSGFGASLAIGGALGIGASIAAMSVAQGEGDGVPPAVVASGFVSLGLLFFGSIIASKSRANLRAYSVMECSPAAAAVSTTPEVTRP